MCKQCTGVREQIRPEPPTELELYRLIRNRKSGKVPPLPTWYTAHVRSAQTWQNKEPMGGDPIERVMSWCTKMRAPKPSIPVTVHGGRKMSTRQYVREFERLNCLKAA
jgi:hypothetical protein